jgi:hypothetical protein
MRDHSSPTVGGVDANDLQLQRVGCVKPRARVVKGIQAKVKKLFDLIISGCGCDEFDGCCPLVGKLVIAEDPAASWSDANRTGLWL